MTIREKFNRRMKLFVLPMWLGIGVIVVGLLLAGRGGQPELLLVIPAVAVIGFTGIAARWFAFRCPRCYGNCGPLIMNNQFNIRPRINDLLKYCPYCGCSWDDELEPGNEREEQGF